MIQKSNEVGMVENDLKDKKPDNTAINNLQNEGIVAKLKGIYNKYSKLMPALAFIGGFLWDALTIGSAITSLDLYMLFAYWLLAGGVMIILAKEVKPNWNNWFTMALQFLFGGLFSALVIFYFKSSGSLGAVFIVLLLIGLLVANEFWQEKYEKLWINWTLFALTGAMFLNFMIPHLLKSFHWFWFIFSCALSFGASYGIWKLSKYDKKVLMGPAFVCVALIVLFMLNVLPPVPLVLKNSSVCHDFKKESVDQKTEYSCQEDSQGLNTLFGLLDNKVFYEKGNKVYYLSSVFAPNGINVVLEHRWYYYSEKAGWKLTDKIPLSMSGGRKAGWRFYSHKSSIIPGKWRVETTLENGNILGYSTFSVEAKSNSVEYNYNKYMLD